MSIDRLLAQTATIYRKSSYNKFGRDQESVGTVVSCRFQDRNQLLQLPNQQVLQLIGIIYFPMGTSIDSEDRILFNGKSYKVFKDDTFTDGRGLGRLVKCTVTAWQT